MDGSSALNGGEVGILLIELGKEKFKYSIRFKFLVTNNMAQYEALLSRLRLAKKIWAGKVILFTDFQLIAQQVLRECEVRDPLLSKYHSLVG